MEVGEKEDVQERLCDKYSRQIYRRYESVGVVFAEWPVASDRSGWKSLVAQCSSRSVRI